MYGWMDVEREGERERARGRERGRMPYVRT